MCVPPAVSLSTRPQARASALLPLPRGSVTPVKVLGVIAMIDDGELDWKVLAIAVDDPLAPQLDDLADVDASPACVGVLTGIREWFRWYKTPDGKPINAFGFGERWLAKAHAIEAILETHHAWRQLCEGQVGAPAFAKTVPGYAGELWVGVS